MSAAEDLSAARITRDEVLGDDPLLGLWLRRLYPLSGRSLAFFLAVTLLPLAALGAAAAYEHRLDLRAMDCSLFDAGYSFIAPGMSFLGDPMVWPFAILIPCAFALLGRAISALDAFFRYPERILREDWLKEHQAEYGQILAHVRATFAGRDALWRRLRRAALLGGLLLFFFNAVTCTLPFYKPRSLSFYTPYRAPLTPAAACKVGDPPACRGPARQELVQQLGTSANPRVSVQKWDTQVGVAPWSWALARLWVLFFGYTWLPLLGYKIGNLVFGLRLYLRELTQWPEALHIQPMAPDDAGGLSVLSSVAFSLVAPLICFGVMLSLPFVKEHAEPSPHDLLLFTIFVPFTLAAFYLPLLSVHGAMKGAKDKQLSEFSQLFNDLSRRLLAVLHAEPIDLPELNKLESALRCLRDHYERLLKMPVWPFGMARLFGLASAIAATIFPLLLQTLVKKLLP
jgi:hypothetical protein